MKSVQNGTRAEKIEGVSGTDGKRGARRTVISLEVEIGGSTASFSGQTIDLSRSGVLLWISDERFVPGVQASNMVLYTERVAEEFGSGLTVAFPGTGIAREAEVIRVTRKGASGAGPIVIAARFASHLGPGDCASLGIEGPTPGPVPTQPPAPPPMRPAAAPPSPRAVPRRTERRDAPRIDRILMAEVKGDYATFRALIYNVSQSGVLLSIDDPSFAPPEAEEQVVLFTKRMGFQFGNGMYIRFLEDGIAVQADAVRVSEQDVQGQMVVVIGCKFRRALTPQECARLEVPPHDAFEEGTSPVSEIAPPSVPSLQNGRSNIRSLMRQARDVGATDLHVKVGCPPRYRVAGTLLSVGNEPFTHEATQAMALDLMTPEQAHQLRNEGDTEFSTTIEGVGRFRVNILRQRGYTGLTVRCIPETVPTLDELGVSPLAKTLAGKPRGLVLVTGPTGSGKSTTLAAMIDHVNSTRACHILTMEDPIEYIHRDKEAHITQREIGRDAISFSSALKRALRQDPDVILVGEMRDLETMSLAITAAETGHLVFATLHTTSAVLSPARIIDVFPSAQQGQIRLQLADSLQGIVSQMLLPAISGGVVLAQEILVATEAVRALIRENKTPQIQNMMQTGSKDGMITLETCLNDLVQRGVLHYETAVAKANFPKQIRPKG